MKFRELFQQADTIMLSLNVQEMDPKSALLDPSFVKGSAFRQFHE